MTTKRRRIVWLILLVPLYAACSMTYLGSVRTLEQQRLAQRQS